VKLKTNFMCFFGLDFFKFSSSLCSSSIKQLVLADILEQQGVEVDDWS